MLGDIVLKSSDIHHSLIKKKINCQSKYAEAMLKVLIWNQKYSKVSHTSQQSLKVYPTLVLNVFRNLILFQFRPVAVEFPIWVCLLVGKLPFMIVMIENTDMDQWIKSGW